MSAKDQLNLAEVSAYLGWTPRFVERLAVGGKLPAVEVDGQWRFQRRDLVDWLDQKIQTLDLARVAELEHRLEAELAAEPRRVAAPVSARLSAGAIELGRAAGSKGEVLRALVDLAVRSGAVSAPDLLLASIVERENLCSTALPGGVALVHPRRPLPTALHRPALALLRTAVPVAFGAPDGELTGLFFLVATLDEREHLHALARLVRILRGEALSALHAAATQGDVIAILKRREAEIDAAAAPPPAS